MVRLFLLVSVFLLASAISGCANYSSSHEYYKEHPNAKLEVPPGLDKPIEQLDMTVPDGSQAATTYSSYRGDCVKPPEPAEASELQLIQLDGLKIKREGSFTWLHATASPQQLWQPAQAFFNESGYTLARTDDGLGIIETDWQNAQEGSLELQSKYRLRFESVTDLSRSEIYLSLRQQSKQEGEWRRLEADHELEIEMLKRLASYLGDSQIAFEQVNEGVAVPAVILNNEGKLGGITLTINLGFKETWRRTIQIIESGGDDVEEQVINQRYLLVRFEDRRKYAKARSKTWIGGVLAPSDKHDFGRFRIEFFDVNEGQTRLQIQNMQGKPASSDRAKRVMAQLEQDLAEQ